MWLISLRDLQWRRRRFLIAVVATALVFALALVLTGVSASFNNEVSRTVSAFGADRWIVRAGNAGPFTGPTSFPETTAGEVAAADGVRAAEPIVILGGTTSTPSLREMNMIGVPPSGFVRPTVVHGRWLGGAGEAVVDDALGLSVGERLDVNGHDFRVVGLVTGVSYFAGQPSAFVDLSDAQAVAFGGQPLATAVLTQGVPRSLPDGFTALTNEDARDNLTRPIVQATQTIAFIRVLLWLVAAGIIAAIVYLSALERTRDFAVLKATGASDRSLLAGLVLQAVILAVGSALASIVLAFALSPAIPMAVEMPVLALVTLPLVAVLVGALASVVAIRRAVRVDPALAFSGA